MSLDEFVKSCMTKYRYEKIPEGQVWHDAHHPIPKCKGGVSTIRMWESDHAIHNVLQSKEQGHPCVWSWEENYLIGDWLYLLPEFKKWMSVKGRMSAHSQPLEDKIKGGKRCFDLGRGCHSLSLRGVGSSLSGAKVAQQCKERGVGIFAEGAASAAGKVGSAVTNSQRWRCLVSGYTTTAGALTNFQKKRNINVALRIREL